ncbi:MAG: fructosamine kinase family protein [Aureliella sp.]
MSSGVESVLAALSRVLGEENLAIASMHQASGGCINQAAYVELADGRSFFIKSNRDADALFEAEALGLERLASHGPLRTPQVIGISRSSEDAAGSSSYLILEHISSGQPSPKSWQRLGGLLAEQHRSTEDAYGFGSDSFIGATPQQNSWCSSWPEFFWQQRLEFQIQLADRKGLASGELLQLGRKLCDEIDTHLTTQDPPSLLHGDLWSGNVLFDSDCQPVIIDPAAYYGHREAELALPSLFGGFPTEFWDSYQRTWPLPSGWQKRLEIYKLYHLLNHLNLFGGSYADQCIIALRQILRS